MTRTGLKQITKTLAALWIALMIGGCSTPVGVTSLGTSSGYQQIDLSALNSEDYSSYTASILHRYDLERFYAKKPTACLIQLHELACADDRDDVLFALAELSFLQGKDGRKATVDGHELVAKNYFTASAIYAYLFLGRLEKADPKAAFDRRFRLACDLYNRSLGYIIAQRKGPVAEMAPLIWLPVGSIRLQPGVTDLPKPLSEYVEVSSADHYKVNGLSVRNRMAGMGAPLVLISKRKSESGILSVGFAATVFMRIHGELADFKRGTLFSEVDVYSSSSSKHSVEVNGREIPLEQDITTPIAYNLSNPIYWQIEKALFRFGKSAFEPGIYQPQPSSPGKIPVLWVHGTMSSPVWWAEMWNTLMGDPVLRENYQHWFYLYDSGKPIVLSFAHLRKSIDEFVKKRDPEGKDPALQQMVVIGHSQGGLLTKATAVETGDALIRTVTGKTLAELKLSPEDEKRIREYTMFTPMPQVKRVVFISTPHRGSFLASNFARQVVKWFISLPQQTMKTTAEVMQIIPKKSQVTIAATSLDSMSPENPGLLALAEIPVSPTIKAHSIIAIDGDEVPPEGDDGVVKYSSAHVTGVESELVVRSYHSCQDKPKTIEEVRRILLEHLKAIKQQK